MSDAFKKYRVGFIGAGGHATWTLYPCFQYFPDIDLVAVCDLEKDRAAAAAKNFGAPGVFTDYRRMLDQANLEALFCCGGPALHSAVIAEAIQRKIPLFIEKPPAPTSAELQPLVKQAADAKVPILIAFMHRFAQVTLWAKKVMKDPDFGKLMFLQAHEGIWGTNRDRLIMDSGIHHIDLLCDLGGPVKDVRALYVSDDSTRHAFSVILRFHNGVMANLNINSLEAFSYPNDLVRIHGDRGNYIDINNWSRVTWHRDSGRMWNPPENPRDSSLTYEQGWTAAGTNRSTILQGYIGEIEHFMSCLKNGTMPRPDLSDGVRALRIVEAINTSAADNGAAVAIDAL